MKVRHHTISVLSHSISRLLFTFLGPGPRPRSKYVKVVGNRYENNVMWLFHIVFIFISYCCLMPFRLWAPILTVFCQFFVILIPYYFHICVQSWSWWQGGLADRNLCKARRGPPRSSVGLSLLAQPRLRPWPRLQYVWRGVVTGVQGGRVQTMSTQSDGSRDGS